MSGSRVDASDLMLALRETKKEEYRVSEQKKLLGKYREDEFKQKYNDPIFNSIGPYKSKTLEAGVYFAMLGALYAFSDRELDPLHPDHIHIFKVIRQDIEKVYSEMGHEISDEETWIFECFDYGIKHIYYLDWQLYLSKICY